MFNLLSGQPLLSLLFLPLLGLAAVMVLPKRFALKVAGVISILGFLKWLSLWSQFLASPQQAWHWAYQSDWIKSLGVSFQFGLDGISLTLIGLTLFLYPLILLATSKQNISQPKTFYGSLLILLSCLMGVFSALDMVLFYLFWEAMLFPMLLLIGIWGGAQKLKAAIQFFLYTVAGSVLLLAAIIFMGYVSSQALGAWTFNYLEWLKLGLSPQLQLSLLIAFALAFAIKVPLFPVHTWLPLAHTEAPTTGSVILAGVLLKIGSYGFLRFCVPLFPLGIKTALPVLLVLSVVGIIYGVLVALIQKDIKKLIAYSSVSHMGYIMLGIFSLNQFGFSGAVLQMVNHGLNTGALFLLVGMIYERKHTRLIADYGGIAKAVPLLTLYFMLVTFASIGLPGLNAFVAEFLILLATFKVHWFLGVLAASGVVLGAIYMLWMVQRVFWGPMQNTENQKLKDLDWAEHLVLIPIIALIFILGIFPKQVLQPIQPSLDRIFEQSQKYEQPQVARQLKYFKP